MQVLSAGGLARERERIGIRGAHVCKDGMAGSSLSCTKEKEMVPRGWGCRPRRCRGGRWCAWMHLVGALSMSACTSTWPGPPPLSTLLHSSWHIKPHTHTYKMNRRSEAQEREKKKCWIKKREREERKELRAWST